MKDFRKFLGKVIPNLYVQHGSHSQPQKKEIANLYIEHGSHAKEENNFPDVYIQQGIHSLKNTKKRKIKEDEDLHGWEPEKDHLEKFDDDLKLGHTEPTVEIHKPTDSDHMKQYKSNYYFDHDETPEKIHKAIESHSAYKAEAAMQSPHLTPEHIDQFLKSPKLSLYSKAQAIKNPNASSKNLSDAISMVSKEDDYDKTYVTNNVAKHPNLSDESINKIIRNKSTDSDTLQTLVGHPKVNVDHVSKILSHPNGESSYIFNTAIQHGKIGQDVIDKITSNHSNPSSQTKLIHSGADLAPHNVEELMKSNNAWVKQGLLHSKHGNSKMVDDIIDNPDSSNQNIKNALSSPHANKGHFEKVIGDLNANHSGSLIDTVFNSGHVTADHVDHIMKHGDDYVKEQLLTTNSTASNHIKPEHIENILSGDNSHLKYKALTSPHTTNEQFEKVLKNADSNTMYSLLENPKLGTKHAGIFLDKAKDIGEHEVFDKFSKMPGLSQEHFDHILKNSKNYYNIKQLMNANPEKVNADHVNYLLDPKNNHSFAPNVFSNKHLKSHLTPEHTDLAMNHPAYGMKDNALSYGKLSPKHEEDALAKANAPEGSDSSDALTILNNKNASNDFIQKAAKSNSETLSNEAKKKTFYIHDNQHIGTMEDVHNHLWDNQDLSKMNQEQRANIRSYTGQSRDLNQALIDANGDDDELPEHYKEKAHHIDAALNHYSLPKMSVYSGLGFNPHEKTEGTGNFKTSAFLSSSINLSTAKGFARNDEGTGDQHVLKINIPEGHKGLFVGNENELTSHHEHEAILPRNHHYKINLNPIRSVKNYDGGHVHLYDTHIVPEGHDPHTWEPPKEDK